MADSADIFLANKFNLSGAFEFILSHSDDLKAKTGANYWSEWKERGIETRLKW